VRVEWTDGRRAHDGRARPGYRTGRHDIPRTRSSLATPQKCIKTQQDADSVCWLPQNHTFTYDEPIKVESCTQAICDLALRFGEGADEEEASMVSNTTTRTRLLSLGGADKDSFCVCSRGRSEWRCWSREWTTRVPNCTHALEELYVVLSTRY